LFGQGQDHHEPIDDHGNEVQDQEKHHPQRPRILAHFIPADQVDEIGHMDADGHEEPNQEKSVSHQHGGDELVGVRGGRAAPVLRNNLDDENDEEHHRQQDHDEWHGR
jgi:hypothetical protein